MLETSATTAKLEEALAKAQASFHAAAKDSKNPHFNSKYADLASIWSACREALTSHGIAVTQWLAHRDDQRLGIITRLAMAGEWMQSTWSIPVSKGDAQGYGSAATYARRYALAAAVGVVADEDDDGNAASSEPPVPYRKSKAPQPAKQATKSQADIDVAEWKMRAELRASQGKLAELRPEFDALPECPAKEEVRRIVNSLRTGDAKAEAQRISSGKPPNGTPAAGPQERPAVASGLVEGAEP